MHFTFAIGNPPYQDDSKGDNDAYMPPVYDKFLDATFSVADKVEMIHPARFLFNAGRTSKDWNRKMLQDTHFKVLSYEKDSSKIFADTEIKGGIVVSYRDAQKDFGAIKIFSQESELNGINHKVMKHYEHDLTEIIFLQNKFNLNALYNDFPRYREIIGSDGKDKRFRNNIFDKIDAFTDEPSAEDDFCILGVHGNKRVWKYIRRKYVEQRDTNILKWKVFVSRVNGTGRLGEVLSPPVIAEPNSGFTQTFLGIGAFDSKNEAENLLKYLKTKFLRTMLAILKVTQDNSRETWKMIPLQDFSSSSDIDWTQSVHDIDQQLYKKYELTDEEQAFIESHVKEMD